jgi:hypothetical protein
MTTMIPLRGSEYRTRIEVEVPKSWTAAQWVSCQAVCEQQGVQFNPANWQHGLGELYIINKEPINGMFIGIEPDGYAHT